MGSISNAWWKCNLNILLKLFKQYSFFSQTKKFFPRCKEELISILKIIACMYICISKYSNFI